MCLQALHESQDIPNTGEVRGEVISRTIFFLIILIFLTFRLKIIQQSWQNFSYSSAFQDDSVNDTLIQGLVPRQNFTFMLPTAHTTKKIQEAIVHPSFRGVVFDELSPPVQLPTELDHEKIRRRSFGLGHSLALNPSNEDSPRITCVTTGSHGPFSGNYSASEFPAGTAKQELPSFQYSVADDLSTWSNIYPPSSPSLEAVGTCLQSSSQSAEMQYDPSSPHNSGLLEAVVYQARTLGCGKSNFSEEKSSSSVISPAEMTDSATLDVSETVGIW